MHGHEPVLVHEKVYDRFVAMLLERLRPFKIGDPLDESVDMGPVASADQEKKVLEDIALARTEGKTSTGRAAPRRIYDQGHFIAPTVVETHHGTRSPRRSLRTVLGDAVRQL